MKNSKNYCLFYEKYQQNCSLAYRNLTYSSEMHVCIFFRRNNTHKKRQKYTG